MENGNNEIILSSQSQNKEATIVVSNKNNNRGSKVFMIIGTTFFLVVAVIVSLVLGSKQVDLEKEKDNNPGVINKLEGSSNSPSNDTNSTVPSEPVKLAIDSTKAAEFSTSFDNILQNVFRDSYDHLIPDDKRNASNLFVDEVTKFKFVYYIASSYGVDENKLYNVNANGIEETGAFAIKYEYFKTYYKELTGQDFNENVLTQVGDMFIKSNDYLYGVVLTGTRSNYALSAESFVQNGNKYTFTVLVKELDEEEQVTLSYKINLELNKINEKYVINSIIVG